MTFRINRYKRLSLTCAFVSMCFNPAMAQKTLAEGTARDISSYIIFSGDANREAFEIDSLFYLRSLPIIFPVSKTVVKPNNPELNDFLRYAVPLLKAQSIKNARIRVRSAASPEGPLWFNKQLSKGRRDALLKIFEQNGITASDIQIDVVDEEYELLAFVMRQVGDRDAGLITRMVTEGIKNPVQLKKRLMKFGHGELWKRIKAKYFPQLRASRFMIIFPENEQKDIEQVVDSLQQTETLVDTIPAVLPDTIAEILPDTLAVDTLAVIQPEEQDSIEEERIPLRELLGIKTNLLEWGAYVPQYGFCPMPNVEVEFYPRHGHWTFGAKFDSPWWIGNTTNHKYFELRNYELYGRYYFRNSDKSYADTRLTRPAEGKAAFQRFYVEGYVHNFIYEIGFSAKKGWVGEGLGGGLGAGYVLPISRNGHWRLDFGLQVGYFWTKYDPFVYGKPIYHGGEIDGNYYYNTDLYRDEFVKRQHRFTWFGPTKVSISLSYDLLYRRKAHKGPTFKRWEEGGNR